MTSWSPTALAKRIAKMTAHNAPAKVAALLAAIVLWWFASNEPGTTTQRSLLVPLAVTGADANEVAVGVPTRVEVVISGPTERMERLRATDVDVELDLSDVDGEFAREIEARAPQALRVVRIVPAEVIGRLEAVRTATWQVAPLTPPDGTMRTVEISVEPAVVDVVARDPVMNRIARVVVPVTQTTNGLFEGPVVPLPIDEEGRAIEEVRTIPDIVTVRVSSTSATTSKAVPVVLRTTDPPAGIDVLGFEPARATIVGSVSNLQGIDEIVVSLPTFARSLAPGRYAVPAVVDVADGVATLAQIDLRIVVAPPSIPMGR